MLEIWIKKEEELYFLCSENKDADQLCSYNTADLHLCFRICKKAGFLMMRLNVYIKQLKNAIQCLKPNCLLMKKYIFQTE